MLGWSLLPKLLSSSLTWVDTRKQAIVRIPTVESSKLENELKVVTAPALHR